MSDRSAMQLEHPSHDEKPFLEHLEDLRWMIIRSAVAIGIGMILGFVFTRELLEILYEPLRRAGQDPSKFLKVLGVVDPFTIQIQIALFGGVLLALPVVLYFVADFVVPALTTRERRLLLPVFASGTLLFVGGVVFCYFLLLPQTLSFFIGYNQWMGFASEWTIQNYLDFVLQMLLAFGLAFELPLVLMVLNALGMVSSRALAEYRRHSFLGIVIFAACVTPTSDLISLAMLAMPMYLLYEATIWLTRILEKRREKP